MKRRSFILGLLSTPMVVQASVLDYVPKPSTYRLIGQTVRGGLILPDGYRNYIIRDTVFYGGGENGSALSFPPSEGVSSIEVTRCDFRLHTDWSGRAEGAVNILGAPPPPMIVRDTTLDYLARRQ